MPFNSALKWAVIFQIALCLLAVFDRSSITAVVLSAFAFWLIVARIHVVGRRTKIDMAFARMGLPIFYACIFAFTRWMGG